MQFLVSTPEVELIHIGLHSILIKLSTSPVAVALMLLGCGSENQLLLIKYSEFAPWMDGMNETTTKDRTYKHVSIFRIADRFELVRRQGYPRIDLTPYLVKD